MNTNMKYNTYVCISYKLAKTNTRENIFDEKKHFFLFINGFIFIYIFIDSSRIQKKKKNKFKWKCFEIGVLHAPETVY